MRILVTGNAAATHTSRWCDWLAGRGHDVLLATLEPSDDPPAWERRLSAPPLPGFARYPLAAPSLARLVRGFDPDLVNAHFVPGYGLLAALCRSARPLAISAWGSDVLLNPLRSPLHRLRARYALAAAGLVTSDSPVLTAALEELGVSPAKIVEQPMGIDPAIFHPPEGERAPGRPLRIVSTRRHEPLYDLPCLLSALGNLAESGLEFTAAVAGDGAQTAQLKSMAERRGLAGRVEFPGALDRDALAELLRPADVYVSTAHSDSTSVSLLEAMASGAFPVVADIPGNRVWVDHGKNGLLFPAGRGDELAACISRAADDPELRMRAAEINRGRVLKDAVWEDNMRAVERALSWLAD